MQEAKKTILAVGAHTGDAQLTCGMLLAKHAMRGDKIVIVDLTAGERGAPKGAQVSAFREQNIKNARAFAQMLGGESIVLDTPDGELYASQAIEQQLARIMREKQVTNVLYHWEKSLHKDHVAAHTIAKNALFFAALPTYPHPLPPAPISRCLFAENWEDAEGFAPYFYFDVSEAFPLWKDAIRNLWLAEHASFPYLRYYEALSVTRGALIGCDHASAFGIQDSEKRQVLDVL